MNQPVIPQALIVGCGYVGQRLAARLAPTPTTAIVSSDSSASELARTGINAAALDLDTLRRGHPLLSQLDGTTIFYLAPPPSDGESDTRINRFLEYSSGRPLALIYMSTTGVYGHTDGAFVDESTPVNPITPRAQRRVSAEEITRVWCVERQVRRVVLRVPGIYGPHRLPLERLRLGEPVVQEEDAGYSNHIHVDDLVEACLIAARNPEARGIYNVTDGNHLTSTAFTRIVAEAAGLPMPREISMDEAQLTFSPMRLSFLSESRRVSNERLLKHLAVRLKYADIKAGVRASLAAG
ncbi:MAG: NAD-dependent epimerase/dehydratase family protein [Steroidobacteraceae bacterium]